MYNGRKHLQKNYYFDFLEYLYANKCPAYLWNSYVVKWVSNQ